MRDVGVEDYGVGDAGVDDRRVGDVGVENHWVGDAGVEDGVTGLPRWHGLHGDARTSVLNKAWAIGLRTVVRGVVVLCWLGGNGWRGLQMT